jgi:hypothetical protein
MMLHFNIESKAGCVGDVTPPENQLLESEENVSKRKIFDEWTIRNNLLQMF